MQVLGGDQGGQLVQGTGQASWAKRSDIPRLADPLGAAARPSSTLNN